MKRSRKAAFRAFHSVAERHRGVSRPIISLMLPILSRSPIFGNRFGQVLARFGELIGYQVTSEVTLYNGMPIVISRGTREGESIFQKGVYERATISLLERIIQPGMVVVDVGANIGQYSLVSGRLVGPTGKVYAVEPLPELRRCLERSIALNGLTNIEICPCAISDFDGEADFYIGRISRIGTSSLLRHKFIGEEKIKVACKTLDTFACEMQLDKIDLIKLDIEGSECSAINGAANVLGHGDPPIMIVEFNQYMLERAGRNCSALYGLLKDVGYMTFRLDESGVSEYTLHDALRKEREKSPEINILAWPSSRAIPAFIGRAS